MAVHLSLLCISDAIFIQHNFIITHTRVRAHTHTHTPPAQMFCVELGTVGWGGVSTPAPTLWIVSVWMNGPWALGYLYFFNDVFAECSAECVLSTFQSTGAQTAHHLSPIVRMMCQTCCFIFTLFPPERHMLLTCLHNVNYASFNWQRQFC